MIASTDRLGHKGMGVTLCPSIHLLCCDDEEEEEESLAVAAAPFDFIIQILPHTIGLLMTWCTRIAAATAVWRSIVG